MTYVRGLTTGILLSTVVLGSAFAVWWLVFTKPATADKPKAEPPATVANPLKEEQINTIVLTAEAVARLALKTAPVERKPMPRGRTYGGEVIVPPGQSIVVSAPVSGVLQASASEIPRAGQMVEAGQTVLKILPLLTPEGRANLAAAKTDAEGLVNTTQTQRAAAQIALTRAQRVLQSEAGSRRAVDEAQALYDVAEKSWEAAIARRDLLAHVVGDFESGTTAPIDLPSPGAGMLRTVSALPGQNVPSGALLFEVVDLRRVWIRVPLFVGDLPEIDPAADAAVGNMTRRAGGETWAARPAAAPPAANNAAGTVDRFYELDNQAAGLSPGERVSVRLQLSGADESLAVPWSAVIHDIHGGTWVYEQSAERTFVRRRVGVHFVSGDTAVLTDGPQPGTQVVTAGAAELFGTETGFTK